MLSRRETLLLLPPKHEGLDLPYIQYYARSFLSDYQIDHLIEMILIVLQRILHSRIPFEKCWMLLLVEIVRAMLIDNPFFSFLETKFIDK